MNSQNRDHAGITISIKFDFAASHRLHSPSLSDEENRALFGKCNNPNGHGHNYVLEPKVFVPLNVLESIHVEHMIEKLVDSVLLEQLDHKHLNTDCEWFDQSNGGVIPSVENIARVCFERLAPEIARIGTDVQLITMTAWETDRTSCTYPG